MAARHPRGGGRHQGQPSGGAGVRQGIGLSGQMHGATLVDKTGNVLRPCILWNDTRSSFAEAAKLDADPRYSGTSPQHRLPGLHRAEARLGEEQRAGDFAKSPRFCCRRII